MSTTLWQCPKSPYVPRVIPLCKLVSVDQDHIVVDHVHKGRLTVLHDPKYPEERWSDWLESIRQCCSDWLLVDLASLIWAYLAPNLICSQQRLVNLSYSHYWTWTVHQTRYYIRMVKNHFLLTSIRDEEETLTIIEQPWRYTSTYVFFDPMYYHIVIMQGQEQTRTLISFAYTPRIRSTGLYYTNTL